MLLVMKAIIAWVIMILVGINLIGFLVRGLCWSPPSSDAPTERMQKRLADWSRRVVATNIAMTLLSLVLMVGYLFMLFFYWNVGLVIAAVLLMASRLPDLFLEIRTGNKVSKHSRPKGAVYTMANFIIWLALPLIWFSLYKCV